MRIDESVQSAMSAIELPEVKRAAAVLAEHGLGVFVPHMHTEEVDFAELPADMVAVEKNCEVSFQPRSLARGVPVGWVAQRDGLSISMVCRTYCEQIHNQRDGEIHKRFHASE